MVESNREAATTFLEAWSPELAKSVEMFTGIAVTIEPGGQAYSQPNLGQNDSILWQAQTIECGLSGSVWIGTPAATRGAVTETLEEDAASRESLYRELLSQSLEGAAHVLSSGQRSRIVCKAPLRDGSPPADLADVQMAWVNIPGHEPAPIFVGFQSDFMALMLAVENGTSDEPAESSAPSPNTSEAIPEGSATAVTAGPDNVFDRLVDLELPIAVVLGRARVRVQEALKLTTGSLVELDRRAGDSVEIIVHNAVVARGEVVSVGGNYGVRIREVISRSDRAALHSAAVRSARGTVQRP